MRRTIAGAPAALATTAAVATVALAAGCGAGGSAGSGGSGTVATGPGPEEVVASFLDARVDDDCDAYRALYTPELAEASSCYQAPLTRTGEFPRVDGAETSGDGSGETATVETTDLFPCEGPGAGEPVEETVTYTLVRVDDAWLIDDVDLEGVTDDDCIAANGG